MDAEKGVGSIKLGRSVYPGSIGTRVPTFTGWRGPGLFLFGVVSSRFWTTISVPISLEGTPCRVARRKMLCKVVNCLPLSVGVVCFVGVFGVALFLFLAATVSCGFLLTLYLVGQVQPVQFLFAHESCTDCTTARLVKR